MSTLADYRASIRVKGYVGQADADLDSVINESRRELARKKLWTWRLTQNSAVSTTLSNTTVSLAAITDLSQIQGVRLRFNNIYYDLDWMELEELQDNIATDSALAGTNNAVPLYWSRRGATDIIIWPAPDQAYTVIVDYAKSLDTLSDPANLTDLIVPDDLRDVVAWGAIRILAFRQRDQFAIQYAVENYNSVLRSALDNDTKQSRSESTQVKRYWGRRGIG
jgi:hypothetical protein